MVIPIVVFPRSPPSMEVLGFELVGVRGVPVVIEALWWWCEYVIVCAVPLVVQSLWWVLIILNSLLWPCVSPGLLFDFLFYLLMVSLR